MSTRTGEADEAQLRTDIAAARTAFCAAAAALTSADCELMMEAPVRGPDSARGALRTAAPIAGQRVQAYRSADERLVAAKRALHLHRRAQLETERQEGLRSYRERCERKTAALLAARAQGGSVQILGRIGRAR